MAKLWLPLALLLCLVAVVVVAAESSDATDAEESAKDAYTRLVSLEQIHPHRDRFSRVKRLLREASMRRMTALEHINNRGLHEKDMARRSDQYSHEMSLRALVKRNERELNKERRKRVRVQKELIKAEETIHKDRRVMMRQQRTLEALALRHKALIRATKWREEELQHARDMEEKFRVKGVDVPESLVHMEARAQARVDRAKHLTRAVGKRMRALDQTLHSEPEHLHDDMDKSASLRQAEKEASDAVAKLDQPTYNYLAAVKDDAKEIGGQVEASLHRVQTSGVSALRERAGRLLDAASAEKDGKKKKELLRQARNLLDLGKMVFKQIGDVSSKVAAAMNTEHMKSSSEYYKEDYHVQANATKPLIHAAKAAPLPPAPKEDPNAPAAANLKTCLAGISALKKEIAARNAKRRQQLTTIGYSLVKLDEVMGLRKKEEEDTPNSDLVLASALEFLEVDTKEAEVQGPEVIQKALVNMGDRLRKDAKQDKATLTARMALCRVYCASTFAKQGKQISKDIQDKTTASKLVRTLMTKMMRIDGEVKEAKRFFEAAHHDAKGRLSNIDQDLTLVRQLEDHVNQINHATEEDVQAVDTNDDSSLMASLEVMAVRRVEARALLMQMTAKVPVLEVIHILLEKLKAVIEKEKAFVLSQLKARRLSVKKLLTHQSKIIDQLDAARKALQAAQTSSQQAKGHASELRQVCASLRQ